MAKDVGMLNDQDPYNIYCKLKKQKQVGLLNISIQGYTERLRGNGLQGLLSDCSQPILISS